MFKAPFYYLSIGFLFLVSCEPEPNNKHLTYQNMVIISDMSSRVDNKPPKDIQEIDKLLAFFKDECVKPGEKIGDRSSICFTTFSDKVISSIDLEKFETLSAKQSFINSTGHYKRAGLENSIKHFKTQVLETYKHKRNSGLDLISSLIEKIENDEIIKSDTFTVNGTDTTFIKFENHLYIFTDGYLEYQNKEANSEFYFGDAEIGKVRKESQNKGLNITEVLSHNKSLGLPPSKTNKNKLVYLHILETHERDRNYDLQTYRNSNGERDNEILEAVWRKWAIESGFKFLEWKKY